MLEPENGGQQLSGGDGSEAPLVDAAERELAENDLSRSYWVEAGAGTGKTTLLIRRLLTIVLQGAARLNQIAAITFTEKAAAELKARLRDELESRAASDARDGSAPVRRALEDLETAPITTIHAFAGSLLRERPVEAGVDPHFKILDQGELEDLLERSWEGWFLPELAAGPEVLTRALTLGVTPSRLRELGRILYHQRDLVLEGSTPEPPALLPAFHELLAASLPELKDLLPACRQPEDRGYRLITELAGAAERFFQLEGDLERERFFLQGLPVIAPRGSQKNWRSPGHCRRQKEICGDLREAQEAARLSIWGQLTADLVRWSRGYLAAVERAKREAGALDFQDLLLQARNLLRDSKEVRGYFQRRFRYLLVDEFQDTDPLQVDLLFLLAEEAPAAASWKEAVPAAGKLFLVGDPKQSIYRFRRADIEIYQAARRKMIRHGESLAITQNFRTLPALIDWVNDAFGALIQPQGGYQPEYQSLSAYRPPRDEPAVILLDPPAPLEEAGVDEIRATEAAALAELIATAAGEWNVATAGGGSRTLRYGDIALLFPGTTGIHHFEEAFRHRGIPFRQEGGRQFYFREEIAFLRNLLTAVSDPHDRVALVAALRYWAGVPDEVLFHFTATGGELDYRGDPGAEFPQLREAFELLRGAHTRQQQLSVAALVEALLEASWFWQRVSLRPHGQQAAANLRKALQMIRLLEMERPLTLKGYAAWLDRMAEQGYEEAESLLHDPGSDAVQFLTIHRSKGLEFTMVCLANLGGRSRGGLSFMADRSAGAFFLSLGDLSSTGLEEARAQERLRLEAERIRLLYVAATRARDYLILPRFYREGSPGYWSYLERAEGAMNALRADAHTAQTGAAPPGDAGSPGGTGPEEGAAALPDELAAARRRWIEELAGIVRGAAVPGPYLSAGALAGAGEEEATVPGGAIIPGGPEALPGGEGASFGSAFHEIMERVDLRGPPPGQLERLADRAAENWGIADRGELLRLTRAALELPLMKRARQAAWFLREWPFIYRFQGLLVEGIVDLLFPEKGGLVIVDYKTDTASPAELERRWSRYSHQGMVYALAMAEIAQQPIKEVSFIFVRGELVKSMLRPDPAALRQTLRENINRKRNEYT